MRYRYKHTMSASDRSVFNRWMRAVVVFYASLGLLTALALIAYRYGTDHEQIQIVNSRRLPS
jgi:hypothetical protein